MSTSSIKSFLALFLIYSCAPSAKVKTDVDIAADYSSYKSFAIQASPGKNKVLSLNAGRVFSIIKQEMSAKKLVEDSIAPDLLIAAFSEVKEVKQNDISRNYNAFGDSNHPVGYWGNTQGQGTTAYGVKVFKEGHLTITIADAKTQRIIWKATSSAKIKQTVGKQHVKKIEGTVKEMLRLFPPVAAMEHVWIEPSDH